MAVLTFSQEFGSGGTEIAKRVAEETGYAFADKKTIGELLAQYGLVGFQKVYESAPAFWEALDTQMMEQRKITIGMMNRTILALARRDRVVIVGRGSYLVLAGFADVINVRVQAPFDFRVARVMDELGLEDRDKAKSAVRESDAKRERFIESAYGSHRDRVQDFNLAVDTRLIPRDTAVRFIVGAVRDLEKAGAEGGKRVSSIEVEPVLMHAVEELFAA